MNSVKILITGDNNINLRVIKNRLLEFGDDWMISNLSCNDSNSELYNTRYNLIILDYEEPSHSLLQKIAVIKKSHRNWNTPTLVCFQEADMGLIKATLEAGVLDFILKPFKPIELFARVRTALTLSSTIIKLDKQTHAISDSQNRISEILAGLLPKEIIDELTIFGESKPKKYREASVLFVDLVDFTKKSTKLSPKVLIEELTQIFAAFDGIIKKNACTRIKTMGDGYLAVSGIPTPHKEHAYNMIQVAIEIRNFLNERNSFNPIKWESKIGINSGEVIGSVLGTNNFLFDVFGDTVNVADRMEKNCAPNQINIAHKTYLLTCDKYKYLERLPNDIKGLGIKKMYYLKAPIPSQQLECFDESYKHKQAETCLSIKSAIIL